MTSALLSFEAAHPEIAAWWAGSTFEFALSLRDQVSRGKLLSERQLEAAYRCAEKLKAIRSAPPAPTVAVNVEAIERAFARGESNGLARPKIRLMGEDGSAYIVSKAPATGKNAGALYVKRVIDDAYMGKIAGGQFAKVSVCSPANEAAIVKACANPEHASVAYGRVFGSCSCCGRTLTNALSIELGIGPICRGNFYG